MTSWKNLGGFDYLGVMFFAELQNNIVAYQEQSDSWFSFPCGEASADWAKCLFDGSALPLVSVDRPPVFFLHLESNCSKGEYHGDSQLIDFVRFLRLSKYHPQAWSSNKQYKLWSSPVVCFSFEARERILLRSPESLILYSPSVRFRLLPALVADQSIKSAELPQPAEEAELSTYVNSTKIVNLSAHHGLGDVIGPYSILSYFTDQLQQTVPVVKPAEAVSTDTLHEVFTQIEQEKLSEDEYTDQTKANVIISLWGRVKDSVAITNFNLKAHVLILDDQSEFWEPMWETLFGGKRKFTRKNKEEISAILEFERNGSNNNRCDSLLAEIREHSLVIMDLRLDPDNDRNKELEDVSGYRLLNYVRENDKATPILMFTSSQRGRFHQDLLDAGADAVCTKPTRLDNASALLEILLGEIEALLKPDYEFLRHIHFELKGQKVRLSNVEAAEDIIMLSMAAWESARRNTKKWLSSSNEEYARSSSLSVARIIGIAYEQLSNHHDKVTGSKPRGNYNFALESLRNNVSHSSSEHAFSINTGYLALELFVEFLSYVNEIDLTVNSSSGIVFNVKFDEEKSDKYRQLIKLKYDAKISGKEHLFMPSYRHFCGAVQAATLLHGITGQSSNLNLRSDCMRHVFEAQQYANGKVREIISNTVINNTTIAAQDIKQALHDYAVRINPHPDNAREVTAWLSLI